MILSQAGLKESDKWAVVKELKPREHLHFLMEKSWPHSEKKAEKLIFNSLIETEKKLPHRGRTLRDYIENYKIEDPSELITVEYLKLGAFLRYQANQARQGKDNISNKKV